MTGHGHRFAMVRKAMLRNGILANSLIDKESSDVDFEMVVQKESIVIRYNDEREERIDKIEELLQLVLQKII